MTWTLTGLSPEGNRYIDELTDERFSARMKWLGECLNHFFRTGTKLRKPA